MIGDRQLILYISKPDDWREGDSRPAIVFYHGGAWVKGKPGQFTQHSQHFEGLGLVCVPVEYRLVNRKELAETPEKCVHDARSAIRWLRSRASEFGIDPNRIASAGGSAGVHLAAPLGMIEGMDAPTDNLAISAKSNAMLLFNPVFDNGPNGYGYKEIGARYREFSPFHNASSEDPPALVFLGDQDHLIPEQTAHELKAKFDAVGVKCQVMIFVGMEHGFFNYSTHRGKPYRHRFRPVSSF